MNPRVKARHRATPEQQRALSSPLRLEIFGQMHPRGVSVGEVARRMGRPPSALYYHFQLLQKLGLLNQMGSRPGTKKSEILYAPVARKIEVCADTASKSNVRSVLKTMSSAFRMAEKDLEAALASKTTRTCGKERNMFASRLHLRIDRKTLALVNHHLDSIMKILERQMRHKEIPREADQYCSLTLALLPLRGRGDGT